MKREAMSKARLESTGLRTEPVRMTVSFRISVLMFEPGSRRWNRELSTAVSCSTEISSVNICSPLTSKKKAFDCPSFLPMR